MNKMLTAIAAAAALASPIAASPAQAPGKEASIPFARLQGVRDFRPVADDVVYLQDRSFRWYRASLYQPCFRYRHVNKIGIYDRGNTVDRFSSLLVDGQRCRIQSLVRSGPPPKKMKARRHQA
jgi:hypothetical protein